MINENYEMQDIAVEIYENEGSYIEHMTPQEFHNFKMFIAKPNNFKYRLI